MFTAPQVNGLRAAPPHHPSAGKPSAENAGSFLVTRTVLSSVPPSQEIDEMDPIKQGEHLLLGFSIQTAGLVWF